MSKEFWCRHFTGVQNETCNQGVKYLDVRDASTPPAKFPCIHEEARGRCPLFAPYTQEEIDADHAAITAFLDRMTAFDIRETGDCPHCGQPVSALRQVGRCVYADPCNCRLWQGSIPAAWREAK